MDDGVYVSVSRLQVELTRLIGSSMPSGPAPGWWTYSRGSWASRFGDRSAAPVRLYGQPLAGTRRLHGLHEERCASHLPSPDSGRAPGRDQAGAARHVTGYDVLARMSITGPDRRSPLPFPVARGGRAHLRALLRRVPRPGRALRPTRTGVLRSRQRLPGGLAGRCAGDGRRRVVLDERRVATWGCSSARNFPMEAFRRNLELVGEAVTRLRPDESRAHRQPHGRRAKLLTMGPSLAPAIVRRTPSRQRSAGRPHGNAGSRFGGCASARHLPRHACSFPWRGRVAVATGQGHGGAGAPRDGGRVLDHGDARANPRRVAAGPTASRARGPHGELHQVGLRMVGDFLEGDGVGCPVPRGGHARSGPPRIPC